MKALLPIALIAVSIGLFFFQINPLYSEVKVLRSEADEYDKALEMAEKLKNLRIELAQKLESFSQADLERLDRFLPRRLDTVRIILDVDGIAARNNIKLTDLAIAEAPKAAAVGPAAKAAAATYSTVALSFRFTATYPTAIQLVRDLQKSLRLLDSASVSVTPSEKVQGSYDFEMTLNTYWLNK